MNRIVRLADSADVPSMAAVLGRAFQDDPVMSWIIPDGQLRERRLPLLYAAVLRRYYLRHAATEVVADGRVLGCAIWAPPSHWLPSNWQQLTALPGLARALSSRIGRASVVSAQMARVHPQQPHWYLSGIGTDPPDQGTGVASQLMAARLTRCDAAGLPAYLESGRESNIAFYERFGFEVTREIRIERGGPALWPMIRLPERED